MSQANSKMPQKLGNYRIIEEVGVGGLGRVFRAIDERTGGTVAVKVLHDKYAQNRRFLGIFHRELLIMAGMHHKHVVGYLDSYFEPPNCFIVTEFVEGWSGHSFIKQAGLVPPLIALSIIIDMMKGIDHLHLHDTIHSDLSASNILIDRSGRVMVTDFGLSCQVEIEDYKNYMIGTPGYYSPEHISEAAICPQTDIYCAGLILYEMIAGRKAVPGLTDRQKILQSMRKISFDRLNITDRALNAMMVKLLKQCLQFNASKRLQTAEHMMFGCYEILKRHNIRYARHAIKKFLIDRKLVRGPFTGQEQDIYLGSILAPKP
ncbi:MAG: serine/threonine protein kinase [Deltaproteobacteria bacterium]|nr:serine/threonine protein kinase [Deltaproteobacteria bacterium]